VAREKSTRGLLICTLALLTGSARFLRSSSEMIACSRISIPEIPGEKSSSRNFGRSVVVTWVASLSARRILLLPVLLRPTRMVTPEERGSFDSAMERNPFTINDCSNTSRSFEDGNKCTHPPGWCCYVANKCMSNFNSKGGITLMWTKVRDIIW